MLQQRSQAKVNNNKTQRKNNIEKNERDQLQTQTHTNKRRTTKKKEIKK